MRYWLFQLAITLGFTVASAALYFAVGRGASIVIMFMGFSLVLALCLALTGILLGVRQLLRGRKTSKVWER
ncbi:MULTISPECIES: hypothetical protein [Bradyrhizobium]|uniref:hypothetical protein n=1 Tax=Bradyrhizobium elkanii TaxID=29448 RepID=UPI0027147E39|nr:hypothetical protein [Bradyrhizobium elkanii]WLB82042.1 hypothetical protein QIH83_05435 [Bradyrhizobium elkanii]